MIQAVIIIAPRMVITLRDTLSYSLVTHPRTQNFILQATQPPSLAEGLEGFLNINIQLSNNQVSSLKV